MKIRIKDKIYSNYIPYSNDNNKEDYKKLSQYMYELGFGYWNSDDLYNLWSEISKQYVASWLIVPDNLDDFKKFLSSVADSYDNDSEREDYEQDKYC